MLKALQADIVAVESMGLWDGGTRLLEVNVGKDGIKARSRRGPASRLIVVQFVPVDWSEPRERCRCANNTSERRPTTR